MAQRERQYLTAVSIIAGVITLIDYNGNLQQYRQRGIKRFSDKQRQVLISCGLLVQNWEKYKELPSNISISFEDPEVMGKAQASYPSPEKVTKQLETIAAKTKRNKKVSK